MADILEEIENSEIFEDLYGTLGVEPNADPQTISKEFYRLARLYHPDNGGSAEMFQKVSRAHEVLKNVSLRTRYDECYNGKSNLTTNSHLQLKSDFDNFISQTSKQLTKEEVDDLYRITFQELKQDTRMSDEEVAKIAADRDMEREQELCEQDTTMKKFLEENKELFANRDLKVEDIFNYLGEQNYFTSSLMGGDNQNKMTSNEVLNKNGLDDLNFLNGSNGLGQMQLYDTSMQYASFLDAEGNDNFMLDSNMYSSYNTQNQLFDKTKLLEKLDVDKIDSWKIKHLKQKEPLTQDDFETFMAKRREMDEENTNIIKQQVLENKNNIAAKLRINDINDIIKKI